MRVKGKITSWKDGKGFGFITPCKGGDQVFVHIKSFQNRHRRPTGNGSEIVSYELKIDERGRASATSVLFSGEKMMLDGPPRGSNASLFLAVLFLLFIAVLAFVRELPIAVFGLYLVSSIMAFTLYALDKSAARNNKWRIKEDTLHLFALIGGWPGALAAQRIIRHKSSKRSFQVVFWITVIINCGVLGWLFTPGGEGVLRFFFTMAG